MVPLRNVVFTLLVLNAFEAEHDYPKGYEAVVEATNNPVGKFSTTEDPLVSNVDPEIIGVEGFYLRLHREAADPGVGKNQNRRQRGQHYVPNLHKTILEELLCGVAIHKLVVDITRDKHDVLVDVEADENGHLAVAVVPVQEDESL